MFKLRGCPKCHGDLYLGEDIYGIYLSCVQCGRYFAVAEKTARGRGPGGGRSRRRPSPRRLPSPWPPDRRGCFPTILQNFSQTIDKTVDCHLQED